MAPMDFLEDRELLRFLRCHKTELSCIENPRTMLRQLRDHNLIPEDRYKKLIRMKSRESIKSGVYELLDWLERKRSQHIHLFWSCIFKETILTQYPQLKLLRNSLMDGSFHFDTQLPEKVETDDGDDEKDSGDDGRKCSEDKEKKTTPVKKKRRQKRRRSCDVGHEEQPGCSSTESPPKRMKSKKLSFSSPLKRGEKGDIWTWPLYKTQLPVRCGDVTATLLRDRLAKGVECIVVDKQWFTPTAFEKFAGKQSYKNWKLSIRCQGTPLGKLIEEGHLEVAPFKRKGRKREHQKNDDECYVCKRGEEEEEEDEEKEQLVVCDQCPRSFHPKCHLPRIEDAIIGDDRPWYCTFCVFKLNQQCLRSADHEASVMSQQISKHMLECQYILLCLRSADEEQLFATNPSLCLKNVADWLQMTHYQTVGDFVSDVRLIFTNRASSSQDNAETCDQLKKIFEEELKKAFNIQQTAD